MVDEPKKEEPLVRPDADAAIDALAWAAATAERDRPPERPDARAARGAPEPTRIGIPPTYPTQHDFALALEKDATKVRGYLDRVVMGRDPEAGLDALLEVRALAFLFPEVEAMVGFGDGEWRHKDVWKHTKHVVRQAVPRLEVRWASLFHDIGKVKTRSITPDGKVHFFGHAEVGARMFDKLDRRVALFGSEPSLKSAVRFLVLHHLRANQYDPSWTDSAVRRFARELADHLDDLLCLARADITTKRPEKKKKGLAQISELAERIRTLAEADAVVPPLPSGIGDVIMKAFALPPSRLIGDIKRALEEAVESGELPSHEPADFYVEAIRANPARFKLPTS
ncbi:MAG: HDIG domain-containing protein [Polyangiaceae bacterium]